MTAALEDVSQSHLKDKCPPKATDVCKIGSFDPESPRQGEILDDSIDEMAVDWSHNN